MKSSQSLREVAKKITQKSVDHKKSLLFSEVRLVLARQYRSFIRVYSLFFENQEFTLLPVLIKYKKNDVFTEACAYVGDMTLFESVVKIIKNSNLSAEVHLMPASEIKYDGDKIPGIERKFLASQIRQRMADVYHQ